MNRKSLGAAMKLVIAEMIAKVSRKKTTDVWLVSERPDQARDNGYCFYKYMREKHPRRKVYYLINPSSEDYKKVAQYGADHIIKFNSWKHYIYYCRSLVHISAHVNGCCPDYAISASRRLKQRIGFSDVFLPHGVSYGISEFCLKKYAKINLFICSGKPEYENVLKNYGYSDQEVAYTGFPRLDGWHEIQVNKKRIVLMPTWRLYIAQDKEVNFKETRYYKEYQKLINDPALCELLETNDLHLVFYLHNEMRKYVNDFSTGCQNIEIVYDDAQYDIQELLKSGALLITDYSSVHFDFAYMNKPVIYYQFDRDEFFEKQYKESFFEAKNDGFGPVCVSLEQILSAIRGLFENEFQMPGEYYEKMRAFYQLYDKKNCQRVYQAISHRIEKHDLCDEDTEV